MCEEGWTAGRAGRAGRSDFCIRVGSVRQPDGRTGPDGQEGTGREKRKELNTTSSTKILLIVILTVSLIVQLILTNITTNSITNSITNSTTNSTTTNTTNSTRATTRKKL